MAAKNPRINVTFDEKVAGLLAELAEQEHKALSSLVRELTLEALEMREDFYLAKIADELDQKGANTCGHDEAWK